MLNKNLEYILAGLPDNDVVSRVQILQCSSTLATGALILHAYADRGQYSRFIIKTPRNPGSNHSLDEEWQNLTSLHAIGKHVDFLPEQIDKLEINEVIYYVYRTCPGRTMFSRFCDRLFLSKAKTILHFARQARAVLLQLHMLETRVAGSSVVADHLLSDLDELRLLTPDLPETIVNESINAVNILKSSALSLPFGRVHGDFSPYNLVTENRGGIATIKLIDWEHSQIDQPQILDVFRFISSCAFMGMRGTTCAAELQAMSRPDNPLILELVVPWLQSLCSEDMGLIGESDILRSLWMMYWVHATLREQRRYSNLADISKSCYLPGLIELLRE